MSCSSDTLSSSDTLISGRQLLKLLCIISDLSRTLLALVVELVKCSLIVMVLWCRNWAFVNFFILLHDLTGLFCLFARISITWSHQAIALPLNFMTIIFARLSAATSMHSNTHSTSDSQFRNSSFVSCYHSIKCRDIPPYFVLICLMPSISVILIIWWSSLPLISWWRS